MALVYDWKKEFPIDPRLNPLRFKRKRPLGRPKKLGLALTREQPLMPGGLEVPGGGYRIRYGYRLRGPTNLLFWAILEFPILQEAFFHFLFD